MRGAKPRQWTGGECRVLGLRKSKAEVCGSPSSCAAKTFCLVLGGHRGFKQSTMEWLHVVMRSPLVGLSCSHNAMSD